MLAILPLLTINTIQAQVPLNYSTTPTTREEHIGGPFGLGVSIGVPTGITGKIWFNDVGALQFGFGGAIGQLNDLALTIDYTFHFRPINVEGDDFSIPIYFGPGWKTDIIYEKRGILQIGPRLVAGAMLFVPDLPIDFHIEVAPTLYVYESVGWSVDGQLGVRYYF